VRLTADLPSPLIDPPVILPSICSIGYSSNVREMILAKISL